MQPEDEAGPVEACEEAVDAIRLDSGDQEVTDQVSTLFHPLLTIISHVLILLFPAVSYGHAVRRSGCG